MTEKSELQLIESFTQLKNIFNKFNVRYNTFEKKFKQPGTKLLLDPVDDKTVKILNVLDSDIYKKWCCFDYHYYDDKLDRINWNLQLFQTQIKSYQDKINYATNNFKLIVKDLGVQNFIDENNEIINTINITETSFNNFINEYNWDFEI